MKKLNLFTELSTNDTNAKILLVQLKNNQITTFAMHLMMLKYGHVSIIEPSSEIKFAISKPSKKSLKKLATNELGYASSENGHTMLHVKDSLLDDWLHFLLLFYRDSAYPVDHLDYQFYSVKNIASSEILYLTFLLSME